MVCSYRFIHVHAPTVYQQRVSGVCERVDGVGSVGGAVSLHTRRRLEVGDALDERPVGDARRADGDR